MSKQKINSQLPPYVSLTETTDGIIIDIRDQLLGVIIASLKITPQFALNTNGEMIGMEIKAISLERNQRHITWLKEF